MTDSDIQEMSSQEETSSAQDNTAIAPVEPVHTETPYKPNATEAQRPAKKIRGFAKSANSRLWRRHSEQMSMPGGLDEPYQNVFTPARPKSTLEEFSGRHQMVNTIIQAMEEARTHVVMSGKAGMGKTSLANILSELGHRAGYLVANVGCTSDLTFSRMMRTIFEELTEQIDKTPAGDVLWDKLGVRNLCDLLGEGEPDVTGVIKVLKLLADNQAIVLIDDFDRIGDDFLKARIVQIMKALSDQGGWMSLIILGRAENPKDLLKDLDSSVNAVWLNLEAMSNTEAVEVVEDGAARLGLEFEPDLAQTIARLSEGAPGMVQWLCLLSVRQAVSRGSEVVSADDLQRGFRFKEGGRYVIRNTKVLLGQQQQSG